jgi:hypothetical protein
LLGWQLVQVLIELPIELICLVWLPEPMIVDPEPPEELWHAPQVTSVVAPYVVEPQVGVGLRKWQLTLLQVLNCGRDVWLKNAAGLPTGLL